MKIPAFASISICSLFILPLSAADPPAKKLNDKVKEIAGVAEFLRSVPKHFATLKAVDPANHRVTLLIEGESLAKVWQVIPDAEIKVAGWWARLDQLTLGDRVWCWFQTDRHQQPNAVSMLCDELSEQDMHGPGVEVKSVGQGTITLKPVKGKDIVLKAEKVSVKAGDKVYLQSSADKVRLLYKADAFEARRAEQKTALRKRWAEIGLPGSVVFLHRFSGEMELMLDHEAIRWGRSLKPSDSVTLKTATPIKGVVRQVKPWRERTQLRLVVAAADLADLGLGQRVALVMPTPPPEVDSVPLPPDLDRPRSKDERVEWFLASVYCPCQVPGNVCTGHFYTLASCNPNGCGLPSHVRQLVAGFIDKGLSDKKILEELLKDYGPDLLRPHLLP